MPRPPDSLAERKTWVSELARLRAALRAKAALDRIEAAAGTRIPPLPADRGFSTERPDIVARAEALARARGGGDPDQS
jgi:hypothetical protein